MSSRDSYIRHAHYIERYKTGEFNKLKPFFLRIERMLKDELLVSNSFRSQKRIKLKLKAINNAIDTIFTEWTNEFLKEADFFLESEAVFGKGVINSVNKSFNALAPTLTRMRIAAYSRPFNNRLLKDALKDFTKKHAKFIRDSVSMGFFEGASNSEIVNRIIGSNRLGKKDGLMQLTRNDASRLVRTSLSHLSSVAKDEIYRANPDIVTGYEWVSVLDGRTSTVCQGLSGQIFETGKGKMPPVHPNCRSTTAAVIMGEVVEGYDNYNNWLKKQPVSFQKDALGDKRYQLWKDGGLTLDKFIDRKASPLNLEQLKKKYPAAWGKTDPED